MLLLVIVTLSQDELPPRLSIVYGAVALATVWVFLTWYMSRKRPTAMSGTGWFLLDSVAMLAIGAASVASGATELFHGGLPLSYVFVGALWGSPLRLSNRRPFSGSRTVCGPHHRRPRRSASGRQHHLLHRGVHRWMDL